MKIKKVFTTIKAGEQDGLKKGQFIVYASTWTREPDAYGDVVRKGAFAGSIERWKASGGVLPGLYGHRMDDPDFFVASAIDVTEDDHGLRIFGEFDLESPKALQVYRLVKGRRLRYLSFAYDTLSEGEVKLSDGRTANELRALEIYEFSFVPLGANPDTSVETVKGLSGGLPAPVKAGRVLAQKHIDSLRQAQEAIGVVIEAAEADQEKASEPEPVIAKAKAEEPPMEAKAEELTPTPTPSTSVDPLLAIITTLEMEMV